MKLAIPALALALAAVDAFRVDVSDVAPPADILGEHQELERTFKVYSEDALEKISVAIAGPVFIAHKEKESPAAAEVETPEPTTSEPSTETPTVTPEASTPEPTTPEPTTPEPTTPEPTKAVPVVIIVDDGSEDGSEDGSSSSSGSGSSSIDTIVFPDGALALHAASHKEKLVATVTISGNSSDLLQLVDIVPYKKDEVDGFRLTYKNKDAFTEGFVLTQIELTDKHALRHLNSEIASVVNVASNVLTQDTKKSIKLWVSGPTNVFVAEEGKIEAENVDLDVAGSGSIQLVAGSLKLDGELSASVAGSGSLAVHADSIKTKEVKTTVSGSGNLFVVAKTLEAGDFSGSVYGSAIASIVATEAGRVDNQKLTVAGSGAVYAGSVVASKSSVDVWGSGQAYVQVTEKLKTSVSYSGEVYYVGAKPAEVKSSSWFFWRSPVKPAESDKSIVHEVVAAPAVYPAYVALELKEARHENEPRVKLLDAAQGVSLAALTTHLRTVAHGPNGFLIFGGVAVGLVAVAMAAQSYQQHRVRRHYTPLV